MAKPLVIVESPTKARTLGQILGQGYLVRACLGHVRDLPQSKLGVDIKQGFLPSYLVPNAKRKIVKELKAENQKASSLILATDPDREGEAIAWHLTEVLGVSPSSARRVAFHELTPQAIKASFKAPSAIDMKLVEAQQARRILDRLVGYQLSPLLWKKLRGRLSAGRVQSAALKMVADREKEIEAFTAREYWLLDVELRKKLPPLTPFSARFMGQEIGMQAEAEALAAVLRRCRYLIKEVTTRQAQRQPPPPFITSTLQQEASRKLRFPPEKTMRLAQQLYEGIAIGAEGVVGLITYMRTDSTHVAASALSEVREFIGQRYPDLLPPRPRHFRRRVRGAQEAHEAIRPTRIARLPSAVKPHLTPDQARLYELIWKRMVASQMAEAIYQNTGVSIQARSPEKATYPLKATSSQLTSPGYLTLYEEGRDEAEDGLTPPLPPLARGEEVELLQVLPQQRFTQPPPRYTEASLIRALEEQGIGRPSTYAPILSALKARGYVEKRQGRLHAEKIGTAVSDFLSQHFPHIVDLGFTAKVEAQLDSIARGEMEWASMLEGFYLPFSQELERVSLTQPKVKLEEELSGETCPTCGQPMVIKWGRYGKFLACQAYPQCRTTRPYVVKTGLSCPDCGGEIVERKKKVGGTFYGCANYPQCRFSTRYKPLPQPCPHCGGLMVQPPRGQARCLTCAQRPSQKQKVGV